MKNKQKKRRAPYTITVSPAGLEQRSAAGSVTSRRKASAARTNGRLGGRPENPEIKRIMQESGVTRQRAHQILKERSG